MTGNRRTLYWLMVCSEPHDGPAAPLAELGAAAHARHRRGTPSGVARGIYPAVLADAGLAGALLELAKSSSDIAVRVGWVPGRMTVRLKDDFDSENRIIGGVAAGEADLGWSGTRAFETLGVTAFQPLRLPSSTPPTRRRPRPCRTAWSRTCLASWTCSA